MAREADGQQALVDELEPTVALLLDRHISKAKEWFPHQLVPWDRGRDFADDWEWTPEETSLPAAVQSSLFVNLLTEDNLPYYFRTIEARFGRDAAWGEWVRRWTAEEGRHSIVIRDYLTVTRSLDPVALERARMAQVQCGEVPEPDLPAEGLVYVALQELATRIAHHNTGKRIDDPTGFAVMKRVAADENLHFLFYRDLVTAAIEVDPSAVVLAVDHEVREFDMPGTGIVDYASHARAIARAGIYDFQVHHDQILVPVVLNHWHIDQLTGLSPEAQAAQESVMRYIARVGKAAGRLAERRERRAAKRSETADDAEAASEPALVS